MTTNDGEDVLDRVENIVGSAFGDFILGNNVANDLRGRGGDDDIPGGEGDDVIFGNAGPDTLVGEEGDDFVAGGTGDDLIIAGDGNDGLLGGRGRDRIDPGSGSNDADGGGNVDLINYQRAATGVFVNLTQAFARKELSDGTIETDTISKFENVHGSIFADAIFGDAGPNNIVGDDGGDQIAGLGENETILGGTGFDLIFGNQGDDAIAGGTGSDLIDGGFGDDTIFGGPGFDVIRGGAGSDLMQGNSEPDDFVWFADDLGSLTSDQISGFAPIVDTIRLSEIFDPDTEAEDVIIIRDLGDDTALTLDLSGTERASGTAPRFDNFLTLLNIDAKNVDLAFWPNNSAIEIA